MTCTFCGTSDDGGRVTLIAVPEGDELVCPTCFRRAIDLLADEIDPEAAVQRALGRITRRREGD